MDTKDLKGLMEAYTEVYAPQEEIEEASYSAKAARAGKDIGKPGKQFAKIAKEAGKRYGSKERGEKVAGAVLAKLRKQHEEVEIEEAVKGADPEMRRAASAERRGGDKPLPAKEGEKYSKFKASQISYIDKKTKGKHIAGYAYAEEVEQIDEISQKTATRAYAARATGEFEYDTNPSDRTKSGKYKSDVAKGRIEKKFGKKAGKHADRAAHAQIFGRRGMPSVKEELDIFDITLAELMEQGHTKDEALKIMANPTD